MIATELLRNVSVTEPCPARWEDMAGDDQCRFCRHCQKNVYNFSSMTAEEVADLLREREGRVCARFFRRPDGTVLTSDCKFARSRLISVVQKSFLGAAAGLLALVNAARGGSPPKAGATSSGTNTLSNTNLTTPGFLGKICIAPAPTAGVRTNTPAR